MAEAHTRPIDGATLRSVLGHFCSGVVVVTGGGTPPAGLTCQSFCSLSLDPPLVMFSVRTESTSWESIRASGHFCVNVLHESQEHLSRRFATSGIDKFEGVRWQRGLSGAPVLADVVAHIDCAIEATHPGGDHTIVVGRVLDLRANEVCEPLLFFRGAYGRYTDLADGQPS